MKRHISLFLAILILFTSCFSFTDSYAYMTDREVVHVSTRAERVNFYATLEVENELIGDSSTIPKLTVSYNNLSNADIFSFLEISMSWRGETSLDNIVVYSGDLSDETILADTSYTLALTTTEEDGQLVVRASSVIDKKATDTFKIVFKELKDDVLDISVVEDYKQNIYSEVGFNGVYLFDATISIVNPEIFTYTTDGNTVTITGLTEYGKTMTDIVIPTEIDGIPVTTITESAFNGSSFESVVISETVNTIGSNAFGNCNNLTTIDVVDANANYTSSDGVLFNKNMSSLIAYPAGSSTSIYTVPDTVETIENAFNGASNLTSVEIPASVSEIHSTAFAGCSSLTAIHVDNYEGSIANPPWGSNATVYWLTLPENLDPEDIFIFTVDNGITTITGLTENGKRLKNLEVPETLGGGTVTTIAASALGETTATEVTIPSTVTTIGDQSQFGNYFQSVKTLNFNAASASKLEYYRSAFADTNITTLNIGETVTKLDDSIFDGMNNLITVNYNGNVATAGRTNYSVFNRCYKLTYFNIGENVTQIPANILYGVSTVKSIEIPANVTKLGNYAFAGTGISSIVVPSTITSVGNYVFANCASLTDITLENNAIGKYMFYNCDALESVVIPSHITSVGSNAFEGCNGLKDITLENKEISASMFQNCTSIESIVIPASITKVGTSAFQNCTSLKEFTLENGLMSGSMFGGCTSLETVIITDNITALPQRVFQGCSGLKEIVFMGATMPTITTTSFLDCTGVTDIYINDEVTSISSTYFSNLAANTDLTIHYNGTASGFPWGATNAVLDGIGTSTLEEPVEEEKTETKEEEKVEETEQKQEEGSEPKTEEELEGSDEQTTEPSPSVEDQNTPAEEAGETPADSSNDEQVEEENGEEQTSPDDVYDVTDDTVVEEIPTVSDETPVEDEASNEEDLNASIEEEIIEDDNGSNEVIEETTTPDEIIIPEEEIINEDEIVEEETTVPEDENNEVVEDEVIEDEVVETPIEEVVEENTPEEEITPVEETEVEEIIEEDDEPIQEEIIEEVQEEVVEEEMTSTELEIEETNNEEPVEVEEETTTTNTDETTSNE